MNALLIGNPSTPAAADLFAALERHLLGRGCLRGAGERDDNPLESIDTPARSGKVEGNSTPHVPAPRTGQGPASRFIGEAAAMSIVRVGLAETKNFAEGYDLIFGKKDEK